MAAGLTSPESSLKNVDLLLPFPSTLPEQYRSLVEQIESAKYPNYPFILRQVYEAGHMKAFLQYLDKRSEARDAEIERVCALHALTLTEAGRDLIHLNKNVGELKSKISASDFESANAIIEDMKRASANVAACGKAIKNTALLMERVSLLKPVITTVSDAHSCLDSGDLVNALRKLHEAWERIRKLPHHIRLVRSIADSIPQMKQQVIRVAVSNVTSALESIRNINAKAGFLTLRNVCSMNKLHLEPYFPAEGKVLSSKFREETAFLHDKTWSIVSAVNLEPLLIFRHLMLNLDADEINSELRGTYRNSYMVQRKNQILQLVHPSGHMHSVENFRSYIQDIVGAFALERFIQNRVPGLSTETFYSDLWDEASEDVIRALRNNFTFVNDEEGCGNLKTLIKIFSSAMDFLHCDSSRIQSVTEDVRELYSEILLKRLVEDMKSALSKDSFEPLLVDSPKDAQLKLLGFPYSSRDTDNKQEVFPMKLPFSSSVPAFYSLIKAYVCTFVSFSQGLQMSQAEVDEKVRSSTNTVLSRNLRGCLCGEIERGHLNPAQLVQYSCHFLEEFISELLQLSASAGTVKIESDALFKDIRAQIEQQIYASLMQSVDAMIDESHFDCAVPEASSEPSPLASRVIRYLEAVFVPVKKMPYGVIQTAWMTACKHIANQLLDTFVHKSAVITVGGVQQLKNDLGFYEEFLLRQKEYTDPSTLLLAFTDIRQLTDLLLLWDWTTYFHEFGKRDAKYNRIQPQTALGILEKMKGSDRRKSNMLDNFRKSERERKKLLDGIVTQLKELADASAK